MEKAIVHTRTLDPGIVEAALAGLEIRPVAGRAELAQALVSESDVLCVVIQAPALDAELEAFLASLARSMARLNVVVICDRCPGAALGAFACISASGGTETLVRDLRSFASSVAITNRRAAHRYDWPLEGFLSLKGGGWESHRVRALSGDGAFLESAQPAPPPGSRARLRIVFQDFRMLTSCEVLDARLASSALPAGFGVRFVDFSPESRAVIDRIVNDALVRSLLNPADEPGAPALGTAAATELV